MASKKHFQNVCTSMIFVRKVARLLVTAFIDLLYADNIY